MLSEHHNDLDGLTCGLGHPMLIQLGLLSGLPHRELLLELANMICTTTPRLSAEKCPSFIPYARTSLSQSVACKPAAMLLPTQGLAC